MVLWSQKLQYNNARDYRPSQHTGQSNNICIKIPPAISFCPEEQNNSSADAQRSDNDLYAQQEMADWAFLMAAGSAAGFLLSIIGIGLIYVTFRATRQANAIARQVGIDETQAYVHLKSIRWYEAGDNFHFVFFVQNSGTTPCLRFTTSAIMTISQPGQPAIPHDPITVNNVGWSALPGNEVFTCDVAPAPAIPIGQIRSRDKSDLLIVSGTIKYQTFYGDWFMSEFSFMGRGRGIRTEKETDGTRMSRTPLPVRVFERIEQPE